MLAHAKKQALTRGVARGSWPALRAMADVRVGPRGVPLTTTKRTAISERFLDVGKNLAMRQQIAGSGRSTGAGSLSTT